MFTRRYCAAQYHIFVSRVTATGVGLALAACDDLRRPVPFAQHLYYMAGERVYNILLSKTI